MAITWLVVIDVKEAVADLPSQSSVPT